MAIENRRELIRTIEENRKSHVICYLTSIRPGATSNIAEDAVPVFFEHLLLLPDRPVDKLDIFLCSNGGATQVPWRLVALFREFAKSFSVLIPYRAYSAATLLALGADEIVMHPFAELGPIDPAVTNAFNPKEEGTGRQLGISVEDVKAYVQFIKSTVGITHEDELVKTIEVLAQKVHPLALGNVERFISQSRMMARKILRTHMTDAADHIIDEIVENLVSKLYFHGHPINRKEARNDLKIKVHDELPPAVETAMWQLYKEFEAEFGNNSVFAPMGEIASSFGPVSPALFQPGQAPIQIGQRDFTIVHTMIESKRLSSKQTSDRRFTLIRALHNGEQVQFEDTVAQGWNHTHA